MKRTTAEPEHAANNPLYRNDAQASANADPTTQNRDAHGNGGRPPAPTIKTEPGEHTQAGIASIPPAPAHPTVVYPYPLPYFHAGPPGQSKLMLVMLPLPMQQLPLTGVSLPMPASAYPGIANSAPANSHPHATQAGSTAALAGRSNSLSLADSNPVSTNGAAAHVSQEETMQARVVAASKSASWSTTYFNLQGEERVQFGMASLLYIAAGEDFARATWRGYLRRMCIDVGAESLLAHKWPPETPLLHLLVHLGLHECLAEVLKTAAGRELASSSRQKDGCTPLHIAALDRDPEAARLLLACNDERGTLRMHVASDGRIPLHIAAALDCDAMVESLLSRMGREQRLAAARGTLPLHLSINGRASAATVSKLLEDCASEQVLFPVGPKKQIPLMVAVVTAHIEAVKLLLAVKETLPQQLALRTTAGESAYDYAKQLGDKNILALFDEAMQQLPSSAASSFTAGMPSNS